VEHSKQFTAHAPPILGSPSWAYPSTASTAVGQRRTGAAASWTNADRWAFEHCGRSTSEVMDTTTDENIADTRTASRHLNSVLDWSKIDTIGFSARDQCDALHAYLKANRGLWSACPLLRSLSWWPIAGR
jgi:hypothetical protein